MGIFDRIKDAIFGHSAAASGSAPKPAASPGSSPATSAVNPVPAPASSATPQPSPVDVEAVLNSLSAKQSQKLNWRTSIVDLMKLLSLDSSLSSRQSLAKELGYTGDTSDSATMNIWLHKEVMMKLAQNGGKVPADLHQGAAH